MSAIKILVATHKEAQFPDSDIFLPIHVGKNVSDLDLPFQGDNTGDNISSKNGSYCELTAMYWAWKNLKNVDYIGLCHYRRYFNFHQRGLLFSDSEVISTSEFDKINLTIPDPKLLFEKHDIIVTKPIVLRYSLFTAYCVDHFSEDLNTVLNIIIEKKPEYKDSVFAVFKASNRLSPCNMMIMKWKDYNDYCIWLFDVLGEAENQINISYYNNRQSRVWGFLAERLFNLYIYHNKLRKKEYPIYLIDDNLKNPSLATRLARIVRFNLSFFIGKERTKTM
ncbi:DUF4422 domain-containing protein [Flavobacterium ovatum]|uniref:DUF4422 domain-containing protein n=1 Tax=Flavobacterium ovatum TaxID=1928857 RepID=UPI00344E2F46